MDAAVLIFKTAAGKLEAVTGATLDPLIEAAKKMRVTGLNGKTRVDRGVVLASWRTRPAYDFIAEKPQPTAPAVEIKA